MAIFQLRMGKVFPIFFIHHPLFRFNFSLLISVRNIVSPDEIQKQGFQKEVFFFPNPAGQKSHVKAFTNHQNLD
jgi:hypothetical protein